MLIVLGHIRRRPEEPSEGRYLKIVKQGPFGPQNIRRTLSRERTGCTGRIVREPHLMPRLKVDEANAASALPLLETAKLFSHVKRE